MKTINPLYSTELRKVIDFMLEYGLSFDLRPHAGGWILCYPVFKDDEREFDIICHDRSYGHEHGLLEVMGAICEDDCDDVEGWLDADTVLNRIANYLF